MPSGKRPISPHRVGYADARRRPRARPRPCRARPARSRHGRRRAADRGRPVRVGAELAAPQAQAQVDRSATSREPAVARIREHEQRRARAPRPRRRAPWRPGSSTRRARARRRRSGQRLVLDGVPEPPLDAVLEPLLGQQLAGDGLVVARRELDVRRVRRAGREQLDRAASPCRRRSRAPRRRRAGAAQQLEDPPLRAAQALAAVATSFARAPRRRTRRSRSSARLRRYASASPRCDPITT